MCKQEYTTNPLFIQVKKRRPRTLHGLGLSRLLPCQLALDRIGPEVVLPTGVQVDVAPRVVGVGCVTGLHLLVLERERHVGRQATSDLVDLLVRPGACDAAEASAELEVLDLLDLGLERLLGDALGHRRARGLLVVGVFHLRDEAGVGVGRVDGEGERDDERESQGENEGQRLDGHGDLQ